MARTQVDSSVRAEALQTVATPRVQGAVVQADPRANKAFALAEALGVAQQKIDAGYDASIKKTEEEAKRYAGSLSAEELGNKIKNGELPNFKSPVFVAQVKRIHGENQVTSLHNQISEDIKNGNVAFTNDADLDKYINDKRGELLAGADRFQVAGFDTKLNDFKLRLRQQNTALVSKRSADEAEAVLYQNMKNIYDNVGTEGDATDNRIGSLVSLYQTSRRDGLLASPEKQKEMLINIARIGAEKKDRAFVEKFLKSDLGNGLTVERVLGPDGIDKFNSAVDRIETSQYYRKQRDRSDAQDKFIDAIEEAFLSNKDIKDIVADDATYGALSLSQRRRLSTQVKKQLSEGGTFTRAHLQEIADAFEGVTDPQEALFVKSQLLQRANSKEERSAIQSIYSMGKFQNPDSDPSFSYGKQIVQASHKSNDFFIGSDTYGSAFKGYQDEFGRTFYMKGKDLYTAHKDVIPVEFENKPMAQLPLEIKRKVAKKIADGYSGVQFNTTLPNAGGNSGLSDTARPVNPNSPVVLKQGEAIKQNGIVIKMEKDK